MPDDTTHEALPRQVTEGDIAAFRRDGVVCLRGAFADSWIDALRLAVDRDIAAPGPLARHNTPAGRPGRFFVDFQLWQRWPACRDFAFGSPAAAIASAMMGSRTVCFYHDHLLVKEPETAERTPWHHDQPYYPIDGEQICSIWLPLDPVGRETAVEYVKRSHRWGRWFAPRFFRADAALGVDDPRFEPVPDIDADRAAYDLIGWDMAPGDCIVFHALTLHGAPGNGSSSRRRRAYATRWLGEDARFAARVGEVSPPLLDHGLMPGEPMRCSLFPQVWPPAAESAMMELGTPAATKDRRNSEARG
jgi:ectoine hydroxylase-related dioxygenase (phytanoyl-CoA dioxygenase family)